MRLPALNKDERLVIGLAGVTDDLSANRDYYLATLREEVSVYAASRKSREASSTS
jgi:hypothetical protein